MSGLAQAVAASGDRKAKSTHDLAAPHLSLYQWVGSLPARRLDERLQLLGDVRQRISDCVCHSLHHRQDSLRGVGLFVHMHTIARRGTHSAVPWLPEACLVTRG